VLRRTGVVVGLSLVGLVGGSVPAFADGWGYSDCSQYPNPGCELAAGKGGNGHHNGEGNHTQGQPRGNHGGGNPSDPGSGGDTLLGGDQNLANCSYQRSDYHPPSGATQTVAFIPPQRRGSGVAAAQFAMLIRPAQRAQTQPVAEPAPGQPGAWYVYQCSGSGFRDAVYRPPVWIPDGPRAGAPPSPAQLAEQAHSQLRLPTLRILANPRGEQLVGLPTWLWLERGSWGEVSATAAVPGVSVTAVAHPRSVAWSMGDGTSFTCAGPGTPFAAGADPKSASPDCGYTYHWSSAGQPHQAYPVTATVHWTVTWSGAGQAGVFPDMTTTSATTFPVAESQAVTTGGG
jgi:hypothetical protein